MSVSRCVDPGKCCVQLLSMPLQENQIREDAINMESYKGSCPVGKSVVLLSNSLRSGQLHGLLYKSHVGDHVDYDRSATWCPLILLASVPVSPWALAGQTATDPHNRSFGLIRNTCNSMGSNALVA